MENIVYKTRIVVPIREMDNQFTQIQDLINAKRQLLIDKQKKLRFISKQNQFLDVVKSDYTKYYMYISEQKRDQMKALQVLDQYIKDLTISGKLTKHNIEDAKEEQYKILKELKMIKGSLDDLVDDSQYIDNTLKNKNI
jgi:cell division septum initiation protein DivIVA